MTAYFFDSSALVKRFAREIGSSWIINLFKPSQGNVIYLARITSVEVMAAISRRMRTASLTIDEANKAIARFERTLANRYAFVELSLTIAERAMAEAKIHGLRGYDAVQLASALVVNERRLAMGATPIVLSPQIMN